MGPLSVIHGRVEFARNGRLDYFFSCSYRLWCRLDSGVALATILALIGSLELVEVDTMIVDRAAQPMPTEIGTLDAIHLASALLWRDATGIDPFMATHGVALGLAAQAHGLRVVGT